MDMITREHSVLTGREDLDPLYTFNDFPIVVGPTEQAEAEDIYADMIWKISRETGCIQLTQLVPANVLYETDHLVGAASPLWMEHHRAFAAFIRQYSPVSVLEIGGGHGILAHEYQKLPPPSSEKIGITTRNQTTLWTIVDTNANVQQTQNIKRIHCFYDENFIIDFQYDTIVFSHLLEHIFEPDDFLRSLSMNTNADSSFIFSIPNMDIALEEKHLNCLHFEHTFYLSEEFMTFLLKKNGFEIKEKLYFKNHSIFYSVKKSTKINDLHIPNCYNKNIKLFNNFIDEYKLFIDMVNKKIKNLNNPLFIFGAGFFASYLINFGIDMSKIEFILDNALNKQEKRFYGTPIYIKSPKCLANYDKPIVILRAGLMNSEIKYDIIQNINRNTIFIE